MAKPRFLFSTPRITQPYRDEDNLETPCSAAVTPTYVDYLTSSDMLASTPVPAHHTIDAPSKAYIQLDEESTQIFKYPLQGEKVPPGPSARQRPRLFWIVLSLAIGVLFILAIGMGVGISSSLHDPANVNNDGGSGIAIESDIHILIGRATRTHTTRTRATRTTSTVTGTSSASFCISSKCPCPRGRCRSPAKVVAVEVT